MKRRTLLITIFVALGAIIVAAAGPSLFWGFTFWDANRRADVEMGPYVRDIRGAIKDNRKTGGWGERVAIDRELISESFEKSDAEANLAEAKFLKVEESFRKLKPPIEKDVDVYQRGIGGLPCNTHLQLYLQFDENEQLVETSAAVFEAGCL